MTPEQQLLATAIQIETFLAPVIGAVLVIAIILFLKGIIASFVAGLQFRRRGFRLFHPIKLNDEDAVIVSMTSSQAVFMVMNGQDSYRFVTIPNTRLAIQTISHIVNKK